MDLSLLQSEFKDRLRLKKWREDPLLWMEERMGIDPRGIKWTLNQEYKKHKWDDIAQPITPDPIYQILEGLSSGQSVGVEAATGVGKAQPLDEPVLTPDGWTKMGDINVGDLVIGSNGEPTEVVGVFPQGEVNTYKITFNDGSTVRACEDHLWAVRTKSDKYRDRPYRILTTKQVAESLDMEWQIPICKPVQHSEKDLRVDPYLMGVLLGDGCFRGGTPTLATADQFILSEVESLVPEGVNVVHRSAYDYAFTTGRTGGKENPLTKEIRCYGLDDKYSQEKEIPQVYMMGSVGQRLALLQGLLDTDGTVGRKNKNVSLSTSSIKLARQVQELVESLGGVTRFRVKETTHLPSYMVSINLPQQFIPFRLPRKIEVFEPNAKYAPNRVIREVEYVGEVESQCIKVAAEDSLYLTARHVVTHNTYIAALIVYWFLDVYREVRNDKGDIIQPGGLVITLSSKQDQLRRVLWKEIRNHWPKFQRIHPQAEIIDLQIRMSPNPESKESWTAIGVTTSVGAEESSAAKIQGYHQKHMLFIVDEATGLHPAIHEAIRNTCSNPRSNLRLYLGNPESQSDQLHRFCVEERNIRHIRVSALDHPNVVLKDPDFIPGAVTQMAIDDRMHLYKKPTHRMVLSRIHGVSPSTSGKTLFPQEVLDLTKDKIRTPYKVRNAPRGCEGQIRYYEKVRHDKLNRYLIFADVAGDKSESGDYHACVVFDRVKRKPVAVARMRGPRKDYITVLLDLADQYTVHYGYTGTFDVDGNEIQKKLKPLLAYEQNAVGGLHLDTRIEKYPNLYHKRSLSVRNPKARASIGWDTTSKTRLLMMDELEEWALSMYDHPDRMVDNWLWGEARTFTWKNEKNRFEAESGYHDDVIMAMAGALVIDSFMRSPKDSDKYDRQPEPPKPIHPRVDHTPSNKSRFDVELERTVLNFDI